MDRCTVVDISGAFDNRGVTQESERSSGAFNTWGNSFPARGLPPVGERFHVGGVPFRLDATSGGDNVRCGRQVVSIPAGRYDWLYLLVAAERSTEDTVHLHFADGGVDPEWLRVSSSWPEVPPWFGERAGLHCEDMHYPRHVQRGFGPTIWRGRIPVTREAPLRALRLPDNPAIHVFALTALRAELGEP